VNKAVTLYTDGSCLGNPGPGGYGAVLIAGEYAGRDARNYRELSQGYKRTTNNRMEMMAVIVALEALTEPCNVELWTDSQYVKNAFTKNWIGGWQKNGWLTSAKKPVKNKDLWLKMLPLIKRHQVNFHWVKGHSGHTFNERCDELARTAASGPGRIDDVEG